MSPASVIHRTPARILAILLITLLTTVTLAYAEWAWWEPAYPAPGETVTIVYDIDGRGTLPSGPVWLHWGINDWQAPPVSLWPHGTVAAGDAAVRSPMELQRDGRWSVDLPLTAAVTNVQFLFTDNADNWDNHFWHGWEIVPGDSAPPALILTTSYQTARDTTTIWHEVLAPADTRILHHSWDTGSASYALGSGWGVTGWPVSLRPGANAFQVEAAHVGSVGLSDTVSVTHFVPQAPEAVVQAVVSGSTVHLFAGQSSDPQEQPLEFLWTPDDANPSATPLANAMSPHASCSVPTIPGLYRFHLELRDPDDHLTRAQLVVEVDPGGLADPVDLDETPSWVREAVVYEIYPRFHSPAGQLADIEADLPRLVTLGVSCLWIMPIFEAPPWNSYAISDYYAVEQDVGTLDDYRQLVQAAHAYGIRVLLDIPINHTGIWHPWFIDAAEKGVISPTWDWYDRDEDGHYTYYNDWDSLPNLNYDHPDVRRYMIEMCAWWLEETGIDGFRADVAWGVHERRPSFWSQWRRQLKTLKPDLFLQGEASMMDFSILEERFDSVMDWPLYFDPGGFRLLFAGSTASQVHGRITNNGDYFPANSFPFRFLENHDEVRYISEHTVTQTRTAAALLLTLPGVPMLYAGQEIGAEIMRGPINWGHDPHGLFAYYARLLDARRRLPALRGDAVRRLTNSSGETVYSYLRQSPGLPAVVGALNLSDTPQSPEIQLPANAWIDPDSSYVVTDLLSGQFSSVQGADLTTIATVLVGSEGRVFVIDTEPFLPADLAVTLVPTAIDIPVGGGDVVFDAVVVNRANEAITRTAWLEVEQPNGTVTVPLRQVELVVPPGVTSFSDLALTIPRTAPPGRYRLRAFLGSLDPVLIDAHDEFLFGKRVVEPASAAGR